jgi:peptidoglycan/LPS O-acetylase OafA/YrhL
MVDVFGQTLRESPDLVVQEPDTPAASTTVPKAPKLDALIGLRGVAAMAVVISHILNTAPALVHPRLWSVAWWFSYTPINLFWDGDESVLLFFVLSGFVLARPFTRQDQRRSYLAYYPQRVLRLYVPLWGGLLVTFLFTLLESRHSIPGATAWTNNNSNFHVSALQDAILPRVGTTFDGPLWSLRWELLFSLCLPLYIFLGRSFKRWGAVKVAAVLVVILLAGADVKAASVQISDAILYMPMFGVGVIMAFYEKELMSWFATFMRRSVWNRVGLIVVAIVTGDMTSEISPIKRTLPGLLVTTAHGLGVLGAVLIILMVISWKPYSNVLETRPISWLGTRSYSLYLIHDAILITIAIWLGGHPNPVLMLVLVTPSCLVAVAIFYRLVERPSHKLSTNTGKAVQRWVSQRRADKLEIVAG